MMRRLKMATVLPAALTAAAALFLGGCAGTGNGEAAAPGADTETQAPAEAQASDQPYAGLETRDIKALDPERVADILEGKGAGYALAAELNHYPGPTHVMEMADELGITPEQEQAVRAVFTPMKEDARRLGRELVDLEEALDLAFGGGNIMKDEVYRLTGEIAAVEGRLRATHLAAHLEVTDILTPEQVALYDELRGYGSGGGSGSEDGTASGSDTSDGEQKAEHDMH